MFGNSFYFLFSKTCFWEHKGKKKNNFLVFWNQKNVWLVEIKKKKLKKKKKYIYIYLLGFEY